MPNTNASRTQRYSSILLALALPTFLVLAAFVFLGGAPLWAAVLGGLFVFFVLSLMVRRHLGDLAAAETLVRTLDDPTEKQRKFPEGGWTRGLISELMRLRLAWSQELRGQYALAGSYETILDCLPYPMLLLDERRRVVRANLMARKLFGRDLMGRDLAQFLRDPDVLDAADAVLKGAPGQEAPFESADTVARIFLVRIEPLPVRTIANAIAFLTFHDVTALKRIEQMRADFVANASHELRTPLATLSGFIETLQGLAKGDAEAHEKFLAIMHEQTSRMSRLVQDLLSLSRVELNELTPPKAEVDLVKILSTVVDGLTINAKAKNETLHLQLPQDFPTVIGDGDELAQIFQNLVDNAIKYGKLGGKVSIEAALVEKGPITMGNEARHDCVSVTVIDEGEGIAKEHLPRLTERFYRVDTARSRAMGGTGLGLAIVKHIVNRHRGALQIESALGVGSRFTVFLPRFKA